jgi:hypothetical protein
LNFFNQTFDIYSFFFHLFKDGDHTSFMANVVFLSILVKNKIVA